MRITIDKNWINKNRKLGGKARNIDKILPQLAKNPKIDPSAGICTISLTSSALFKNY